MSMWNLTALVLLTVLLLVSFVLWYCAVARSQDVYNQFGGDLRVIPYRVIDGDTFVFNGISLRLNGADAPELKQLCTLPEGRTWPCGVEAKEELKNMLDRGQILNCKQVDVSYGRPVVQCTIDGLDPAYELIRGGLAFHASEYTEYPYKMKLSAATVLAWAQGIGVWKQPLHRIQEPKNWRDEQRKKN